VCLNKCVFVALQQHPRGKPIFFLDYESLLCTVWFSMKHTITEASDNYVIIDRVMNHFYLSHHIFVVFLLQFFFARVFQSFNFDLMRTCTTGKCRDPTLWWCWQTPKVMSKDTECLHGPVGPTPIYGRMTLRWPPIYHWDSGCRIVQRNRCPPNHPVVGMTSGISENMLTAYLPLAWRITRCTRSRRVRRQGKEVVGSFREFHWDVSTRDDGHN
jgi:hypothetical protein